MGCSTADVSRIVPRDTPEQWVTEAKKRWSPIRTFCLFSGGNDSGVLAHRCRDDYDVLLFIDTGLAVPGVEGHVIDFAKWLDKPLMTVRSGHAYREMVLGGRPMSNGEPEPAHGFPGKGHHGKAYSRLKERRIEEVVRCTKIGHPRSASVLFLSGVRRDESQRRSKRMPLTEHHSAKYCNPLIEWTNAEMRDYRERHELPESDVASLLHRSGECNCGAFADAEAERAMLKSLWPEWWADTIESLEREAEERGIRWCRWGGYDVEGNQAAGQSKAPGLLCSSCITDQLALAFPTQQEPN